MTNIIIGIVLGIIVGIVHGVHAAYLGLEQSNIIGDEVCEWENYVEKDSLEIKQCDK